METQPAPISPRPVALDRLPAWSGPLIVLVGLGTLGLFLVMPFLGMLATAGLLGLGLLLVAHAWPMTLVGLLLVVGLANLGVHYSGAVLKLSEPVIGLMLTLLLVRLIGGDDVAWSRVRRAAPLLMLLGLLAVWATATAAPHPNLFNVRYEFQATIALVYTLLFFRKGDWPALLRFFVVLLALESVAALVLKFALGYNGLSFQEANGGVKPIVFTEEDLENFAGGWFRLAGTMSHKNMLAAFYVLLLPPVCLDLLRQFRPWRLAVVILSLVVLGMTDSMTGWGAMMLIVVTGLLLLRRFDHLALLTLLVLPLAALGLVFYGESIFFRIEQLFTQPEGMGTVFSRVEMLQIAARLIAEHPLAGIGRLNYTDYGETYYSHAHNLFLMKVIEMGVAGGIAFTVMLLGALGAVWHGLLTKARSLAASYQYYPMLGLGLGLLGFVAMNVFDYNYAHFSLGPMFMMLLGVGLAVTLEAEAPQTPPAQVPDKADQAA